MEQFPLDDSLWSGGLKPADYFQSLQNYKHLVLSLYRDAGVDSSDREPLIEALDHYESETAQEVQYRFVILTEDWCGDSASTLPYVARLAEELAVEARVFRQSRNPALKEWYVNRGTEHIPVVSLVRRRAAGDEDSDGLWREVFRWVERPAAAHGKVEAWLADQPRFGQLRAAKDHDPAAAKEYFALYARLLREMASWYRNGLWSEIAGEFARNLSRKNHH